MLPMWPNDGTTLWWWWSLTAVGSLRSAGAAAVFKALTGEVQQLESLELHCLEIKPKLAEKGVFGVTQPRPTAALCARQLSVCKGMKQAPFWSTALAPALRGKNALRKLVLEGNEFGARGAVAILMVCEVLDNFR